MYPVFDGHNDLLLRLHMDPSVRNAIWLTGQGKGHLDLPRMRAGGFAGGFFAIFVPPSEKMDFKAMMAAMDVPPFDLGLPKLMTDAAALGVAMAQARMLLWMERAAPADFKVCRTAAEVRHCLATGVIAGIMHMEGAEAIDEGLDNLYAFHAMGLRSLGPVWSRPTIFAEGVPFAFPSSPDRGAGLTDAGKRLIKACNDLKIMVDLSHLNEKGFDDVARISDAPLVATHSNAHAVTASSRNLTDRQLAMIRESGGMVGLNFATSFLRRDGKQSADMGWEDVMAHLDHFLDHLGEDHLGFGSDFDGATVPKGIGDVTGLPALQQAMIDHGFGGDLMRKICSENWLALLDRTWGAQGT